MVLAYAGAACYAVRALRPRVPQQSSLLTQFLGFSVCPVLWVLHPVSWVLVCSPSVMGFIWRCILRIEVKHFGSQMFFSLRACLARRLHWHTGCVYVSFRHVYVLSCGFTQCLGFCLCPPSHPISCEGGAMGSVAWWPIRSITVPILTERDARAISHNFHADRYVSRI